MTFEHKGHNIRYEEQEDGATYRVELGGVIHHYNTKEEAIEAIESFIIDEYVKAEEARAAEEQKLIVN